MADAKLSPEVVEILKRSEVTASSVKLPAGQLPRPLYEAVNKVLTLAGGKWNRSAGAHLFTSDPRPKLGLALETGVAIDQKKKLQAFYTPKALADHVAWVAQVSGHRVLEPSAGDGALADACREAGAKEVVCVEVNAEEIPTLRGKGYETRQQAFLTTTAEATFDRVVMNPPFTRNLDVKHVAHALKFLKPGGLLTSIMAANTSRNVFKKLVEGLDHEIENVEAGAFKESGTSVATIILTVRN